MTDDVNYNTLKRYIKSNISELELEDKKDIYIFLRTQVHDEDLFNNNADGIRIDLDEIDEVTIHNLYSKVKHKIEKK